MNLFQSAISPAPVGVVFEYAGRLARRMVHTRDTSARKSTSSLSATSLAQ